MVPLCTSAIDLPPICLPTICPLVPLSIQPIQPPVIPPVGTTSCEQKQVWSLRRGRIVQVAGPDVLQGEPVDAGLGEGPPDQIAEVLTALVEGRCELVECHGCSRRT
jgi:hypothetical protein